MKKEIFKRIPGFEDYAISKNGKVLSHKSGEWEYLKLCKNQGYRQVNLYRNKIEFTMKVGALMLMTFIGPCPKGKEISHLNGDSLNDKLENLIWETKTENQRRRIEHGTSNIGKKYKDFPKGENNRNSKLTNEDIIKIRELIKQGFIQGYIAGMFNVSQPIISGIKINKRWKHI